MSKNRSSFLKRDREARKREKQAMKKQRREDRKLSGDQADAQDYDTTMMPPEDAANNSNTEATTQFEDKPPQA